MRKVIYLMHVSLDGFIGGPNGEMDWIQVGDEMFDDVGALTASADTAIYGKNTFKMMEGYWPTAGDEAGASKHDKEHSEWANNSLKLVFSTTLDKTKWKNTRFVKGNVAEEIGALKQQPGKNLLMIGSSTLSYELGKLDLIDEYYLNINPIILGTGIPLFLDSTPKRNLELIETKKYKGGVVGVHYSVKRD